jgi:hypothetical protein
MAVLSSDCARERANVLDCLVRRQIWFEVRDTAQARDRMKPHLCIESEKRS